MQTQSNPFAKSPSGRYGKIGVAPLLALGLALSGLAIPAQTFASPSGFRLPEPSPTPTPAPQGPADVRAGVPIGPRAIRTDRPTPTPTPQPTARSTSAPATTSTAAPANRTPSSRAPASQPASPGPATVSGAPSGSPVAPGVDPQGTGPLPGEVPLDDTIGGEAADPLANEAGDAPAATPVPQSDSDQPTGSGESGEGTTIPSWLWIAGLLALVLTGLGALLWMRQRAGRVTRLPPPAVAASADAERDGAFVADPPRIDLALDIISASRSVMMFTLEYRLNLSNRSARAVRDLTISAQLASAQRGGANAPPIAAGHTVATIERIGPHQSRAISGQMQIPLADVRAILQGRKPLFIPLLHLTLEAAGQSALTRSFVVGTPSAASQGRLHPIPLDTPPGGVPGLKAREISLAA